MAFFSSINFGLSLEAARLGTLVRKRGRGRPRKARTQILFERPRRRSGRPAKYEPAEIVAIVDAWKTDPSRDGAHFTDARAIGELLYEHAPVTTRRRLDRKLEFYRENTGTRWAALRKAIVAIEGTRFKTLKDIVARARKKIALNGNDFPRNL